MLYNSINRDRLICGESELLKNYYYFKVKNPEENEQVSSDIIIEVEAKYSIKSDLIDSKLIKTNSKNCFQVEENWSTIYVLNLNKHQGAIIRLDQMEKGTIQVVNLEQISMEQDIYEYRECNHFKEMKFVPERMVYDLADLNGEGIQSEKYLALFRDEFDKTERLAISEGGCVVLSETSKGIILISDGQKVLEYKAFGRIGESEPYSQVMANQSELSAQIFQNLYQNASPL